MKSHLVFTALMVLSFLAFAGCVSIDINPSKTTKADDFDYSDPKDPFDDIKADEADYAWQSENTGNTIAIITSCNKNADPSLKSLEVDTLGAMADTKVLSSNKVALNKNEALKTLVEGQVDGVAVQVLSYSLKRNNCTYSLTYVGRKNNFQKELPIFEAFTQEFEFE